MASPTSILSLPAAYRLFRQVVVGPGYGASFVGDYLKPVRGEHVLDLGCGTGDLVQDIPDGVRYTGVDFSADYIRAARERHGTRPETEFILADVNGAPSVASGSFDIAAGAGILHHLSDAEIPAVLDLAWTALRPGGRFATIDPCYREGQPWIATMLMRSDRGKFVRPPQQYRELAARRFPQVKLTIRTDLLRVPYSHAILLAVK